MTEEENSHKVMPGAAGLAATASAGALGAGVLGYRFAKEGMYEGALDAFDVSYESLKAASSPVDHVVNKAET